tara:strand:+ start:1062 stop:1424 length:363 start_codon:yes stop_codon:yes gene_type:complete
MPKYRPVIKSINQDKKSSIEEYFQNNTLRPILKMKNHLLINFFKNYLLAKKVNWEEKSNDNKEQYIYKELSRDVNLKNSLIHMVIGNFSCDEYSEYLKNSKEYNKRIWKMAQQRLYSQFI